MPGTVAGGDAPSSSLAFAHDLAEFIHGVLRDLAPSGDDVMTHGDLIPGNVLVIDRRLAGVIDAGGLGPADRALDPVAAWHLLDAAPREVLRNDLEGSDLEWARGAA